MDDSQPQAARGSGLTCHLLATPGACCLPAVRLPGPERYHENSPRFPHVRRREHLYPSHTDTWFCYERRHESRPVGVVCPVPRASVQWRQGRMETTGRCCTGHAKTPPGRPPRPCLCRQTGLETPAQRPVPGGPPSHAVSLSPQRLAHTGRESPSWSRAPCPNPLTTSLPVQECRPCALGVCPCQRSRGDMPGLRRGAGPARVPGCMDVGTGCQRLSRSAAATPLLTRAVV